MTQHALYGSRTKETLDSFPILCAKLHPVLVRALGMVKFACARESRNRLSANAAANIELPLEMLDARLLASAEIAQGKWDCQFPLDPYQSDFSRLIEVNADEVIFNRALELCGQTNDENSSKRADLQEPNDGEFDAFAMSAQLAAALTIANNLIPNLKTCAVRLRQPDARNDFQTAGGDSPPNWLVDKQDRLLQRCAAHFDSALESAACALDTLARMPLYPRPGQVVTDVGFGKRVIELLSRETKLPFAYTGNDDESLPILIAHDQLAEIARILLRVANDAVHTDRQADENASPGGEQTYLLCNVHGSMIADSLVQVALHVVGNDEAIKLGTTPLSRITNRTMLPMVGFKVVESISLLNHAIVALTRHISSVA